MCLLTVCGASARALGRKEFNRLYPNLASFDKYGFNQRRGLQDGPLMRHSNVPAGDWVIGDWGYYINETEWEKKRNGLPYNGNTMGENVIYLGDDKYFGIPVGVNTKKELLTSIKLWGAEKVTEANWRDFSNVGLLEKKEFLKRYLNDAK